MASYNRIIMMGNLTRDPEFKQLSSGQAVCRFGLASNRQFKNKQTGTMVQEVCFIDVDVWGAQAEVCNQYLQKGRSVLVEGRLKLDSWEDNEGKKRSKHSIVADRVTFLASATNQVEEVSASNQEASFDMPTESAATFTAASLKEKVATEIAAMPMMKATATTGAKKAKAARTEASSTGEIEFKDEAPFEEELPF